ncbi:hypothetical protein ASE17_13865 [Phenylobacterium sp. Root77]|uniref:hypothetical protein n=1 Tax=unclassified Phenylobacterium TaxID=2640670 RepID=UPI0006F275B2|nr:MULTISPECIES: hypothetical protein [unclassified Phenylobacterium]KQW65896.1 hypothetical protein ASC73_19435 [Phenylobacterium sp. Root1277]KQW95605.1 hypothetical protein ASC79_07915 [Phenylobacterium sp. Root1290]KRC41394.1 hypothetical protein ASE17_13865 [Phenylobacterium sp. Root77]
MSGQQVHFEVFIRRAPGAAWKLDMATENRSAAISSAEELMAEGRVAAVRVTKETLDSDTREFQSITILSLGATEAPKKKKVVENQDPLCVSPQDLYTVHARERIGRLLEGWLERKGATPFELLHRPDLVEELEASGTDLQHAIQKVAIPEAQARGLTVHELIRTFSGLVERAIDRLLKDFRKGGMPNLDKEGFARAAERVSHDPERAYLLGAGVAASIAPARSWSEKVSRLLDLADAAPVTGPPRGLALQTVEQPLAEILGSKSGLDNIIGQDLDLGGQLAAMTRLAACETVDALIRAEPSVAKMMPPLSEAAMRLSKWLAADDFASVRVAIAKRVVRELNGPRRLRPSNAAGEIEVMRGLAMTLTAAAAAGALLNVEDVQSAFVQRSRMLVTSDFVEAYLGGGERSAREEIEALVWLVENVIGGANKRQAGRYLSAGVSALRFEKEFRYGPDTAAVKLQKLAALQRAVARGGLAQEDYAPIQAKIGDVGGLVEADARLIATLAKTPAPPAQKLLLLLKLAAGETAPVGPAADRARQEAMRLVRQEDTRAELAANPERMDQVRNLIHQLGMAA